MSQKEPDGDPIARLLTSSRTIAVVGCSRHPEKDAHRIPAFLKSMGYRVIPVNPNAESILGEPSHPELSEMARNLQDPVDLVNVFRPPADTPPIARQAAEIDAGALWLQLGITNDETARVAEDAGMFFVQDRCMRVEYKKRFGETPLSQLTHGEKRAE